jgi:hypothetical protein
VSISSFGLASIILEDASSFNATVSTKQSPLRSSRKLLDHGYYIYFENTCRYSIKVLAQAQLPHDVDTQHCNNAVTSAGSWCYRGFYTLGPGESDKLNDGWTISGDQTTGNGYYFYAEMVEANGKQWEGDDVFETEFGISCVAGTSGCYGFIRVSSLCGCCNKFLLFVKSQINNNNYPNISVFTGRASLYWL